MRNVGKHPCETGVNGKTGSKYASQKFPFCVETASNFSLYAIDVCADPQRNTANVKCELSGIKE